jgi:hypothetical protein
VKFLNLWPLEHVDLLAFWALNNLMLSTIHWLLITFNFVNVQTFLDLCDFHEVKAASRAERMTTADVHNIDILAKTIRAVSLYYSLRKAV